MKNHLLGRTNTYLILMGVCVGIILLVILGITVLDIIGKAEYINDNITEGIIFLICIPGILAGSIGAIICTIRKKWTHT
jgi:predicted Na+-dependent transporter